MHVIIVNMLTKLEVSKTVMQLENNSIIRKFIHTDRLHKACVDRMISKIGLHRSQHMMLMFLSRNSECITQKEISRMTEVSPAAVAVALKKLENGGYIEKKTDTVDGRFNKISITDSGRDIVRKSREIFSYVDDKMCMGIDSEELEIFEKCLDRMYENLKGIDCKGEDI